ncbi:TetR/AcrR family transcriptional regulator [Galbitalea sp. SE-J8]|uniref:TetR/AcrR family transcriptional regulator n=1 Tax=Galbitalea sp. SE-J8 TaxID=3054952 RepID=UPI00259C6BE7|nr:TetR/AcrR family transcriptional regulator [Galbitalea sp. SE-J8]MDM4762084.1 TetR/AcrR family transcriptional regulator [Galbitalea sp. SE-J8]
MAGTTKDRMIDSTITLLAMRGLQGTAFRDVVEHAGAPRGSIYHHFPEGKDQLVNAAVDAAGARAASVLDAVAGRPPLEITERFLAVWRAVLDRSELRAGCAVLAVTVATDSTAVLDHAARAFRSWRARIAELLEDGGADAAAAARFAATLVAACEGAVVIARAERSTEPFELVADQLREAATRLAPGVGPRE